MKMMTGRPNVLQAWEIVERKERKMGVVHSVCKQKTVKGMDQGV
jgi:hypothetical protein